MITVAAVEGTELHHQYPGQSGPQRCYVELDARTGELGAESNPEIGNAYPFDVHHGHRIRWSIPALKAPVANVLLEEIAPIADRIVAGYERVWDGSNNVARYTDDARAAEEEIGRLCEATRGDGGELVIWDASDWYAPLGTREQQARELGITASTTDAELEAIGEREEATAATEVDGVEEIAEYLVKLRDHAIEACS